MNQACTYSDCSQSGSGGCADCPAFDRSPADLPEVSLASASKRAAAAGRSGVPSPCIGVCKMVPATGWCGGCHRTIDEITRWSKLDDVAKLAMWTQIEQRDASLRARSAFPVPVTRHPAL